MSMFDPRNFKVTFDGLPLGDGHFDWRGAARNSQLDYYSTAQVHEAFIKAEMQRLGLTLDELKKGYHLEVDQNQRPIRLAVNTKGATIIDEIRP